MKHRLIRSGLTALFLLAAPYAPAEEIVAVLDLKFIEDTGDTAVVFCFGEDDEDCGTWATYYLFEARVDKIISGDLPDKRFLVIYGKHALKKRNFRNVIALLKRREGDDPSEPQYRITQWGEKRKMYCFDRREDEGTEIDVERNYQHKLNCYDQKFY